MLRAMADASPVNCTIGTRPRDCDLLLVFGGGGKDRLPKWQAQVQRGRHAVLFDLGYWSRESHCRLSIDALHPRPEQITGPGRPHGRELRDDYDPQGPIILARMGRKSAAIHDGGAWDRWAERRIRETYPRRTLIVRDKSDDTPIEDVLQGASLVVCRHSNVAVDACVAGVPVVCKEGAARALYGDTLATPVLPTRAERDAFLSRLACWQWSATEAEEAWKHILACV